MNNMYQLAVTALLLAALNCANAVSYQICKRKWTVGVGDEWIDIYSENWPNNYADRRNCKLQLKALDKTKKLMMDIVSINTERRATLNGDWLKIWGAGKELAFCTFKHGAGTGIGCWNKGPIETGLNRWLMNSNNLMRLQWFSDNKKNYPKGFHVRVKQVPETPCKEVVGKSTAKAIGKTVREGLEKYQCKAHCMKQRETYNSILGMTYDTHTGACSCIPGGTTGVNANAKSFRTCRDMHIPAPKTRG